jgi:hypothetical protein
MAMLLEEVKVVVTAGRVSLTLLQIKVMCRLAILKKGCTIDAN